MIGTLAAMTPFNSPINRVVTAMPVLALLGLVLSLAGAVAVAAIAYSLLLMSPLAIIVLGMREREEAAQN